MKYGIEAEGRYKGVRSIFCENVLEFFNISVEGISLIAQQNKACHIAIMDLTDEIDHTPDSEDTQKLKAILNEGFMVTIECTTPPNLIDRNPDIFIVKHINDPAFFNLLETDQIKFVDDEINRNVRMTPVESMIPTSAEAFLSDREV